MANQIAFATGRAAGARNCSATATPTSSPTRSARPRRSAVSRRGRGRPAGRTSTSISWRHWCAGTVYGVADPGHRRRGRRTTRGGGGVIPFETLASVARSWPTSEVSRRCIATAHGSGHAPRRRRCAASRIRRAFSTRCRCVSVEGARRNRSARSSSAAAHRRSPRHGRSASGWAAASGRPASSPPPVGTRSITTSSDWPMITPGRNGWPRRFGPYGSRRPGPAYGRISSCSNTSKHPYDAPSVVAAAAEQGVLVSPMTPATRTPRHPPGRRRCGYRPRGSRCSARSWPADAGPVQRPSDAVPAGAPGR